MSGKMLMRVMNQSLRTSAFRGGSSLAEAALAMGPVVARWGVGLIFWILSCSLLTLRGEDRGTVSPPGAAAAASSTPAEGADGDNVNIRQHIKAFLERAREAQIQGDYPAAFEHLKHAREATSSLNDLRVRIAVNVRLSDLYLAAGERTSGEQLAYEVLEEASALEDLPLLAAALNNWGNVMAIYTEYDAAIEAYDAAFVLGEDVGDAQIALSALLNMIKTAMAADDVELALEAMKAALEPASELPENAENMWLLLSLAIEMTALSEYTEDDSLKQFAWNAFVKADVFGKEYNDTRLRAYANGYLGALYASEESYEPALRATRRALFFAQQGVHSEILYRWQWQLGRLFKATRDIEKAITTYQEAITTLQPIRGQLLVGRRGDDFFDRHVKQVYYELAEIYLEESESQRVGSPDERQMLLKKARDVIEQMKLAEVENLFQDDCVADLKSKVRSLDDVTEGAAVMYPILLEERLEVLVTLPGKGIYRAVVPVGRKVFEAKVRELRRLLQTRLSRLYMRPSQEIYDWMIRPLEDELRESGIDTLIVVPEGVLSLIPFAALHNGEYFLIQDYAVATTPGLNLTDPQPVSREHFDGLLVGLSEAVQGYSALPNVPQELEAIGSILGVEQSFLNETYSVENVTKAMEANAYRVLHMATHGEFSSSPEETYLLTYDEKLYLDNLERLIKLSQFREEPLELLTLSACRTAVGDEKASFGLAGVAVKSGARSALATLWFVDDEATRLALTQFYSKLYENPHLSKARALQEAQVSLIQQPRYRHPAYWAPFMLIGNWL